MRQKLLTRADEGVGEGVFDSVKWAFETHLKRADNPQYNSAILYGNEDCPNKIEFFESANPNHDELWDLEWRNPVFHADV